MFDNLSLDWTSNPEAWVALATLTALELVLGIDNVIFIAILADKLPEEKRARVRRVGLLLAMLMRIVLLFFITLILSLDKSKLFTAFGHDFSGKDLVLVAGGLFLLGKATHEIHNKLEGAESHEKTSPARVSVAGVIMQILLLDLVFSIDSVVTAVGMVKAEWVTVMMIAVVISVLAMLALAGVISRFVSQHPTVKILALSFLLLIGMTLVADGTGHHISKGYVYFAMGFSIFVELLNMRLRKVSTPPVDLRDPNRP